MGRRSDDFDALTDALHAATTYRLAPVSWLLRRDFADRVLGAPAPALLLGLPLHIKASVYCEWVLVVRIGSQTIGSVTPGRTTP